MNLLIFFENILTRFQTRAMLLAAGPPEQVCVQARRTRQVQGMGLRRRAGCLRFHGLKSAYRRFPAVRTTNRGLADAPPLRLPGCCRSAIPLLARLKMLPECGILKGRTLFPKPLKRLGILETKDQVILEPILSPPFGQNARIGKMGK